MSEKVCNFVTANIRNYKCKIMINRINLILRAKNITARQFAEEIGIQPSGMSHILGGRNNPSLDFVTKVIRRYPEIDANWLLMGRGEMYASGHVAQAETKTDTKVSATDDLQLAVGAQAAEAAKAEPTLFSPLSDEQDVMPKAEEAVYSPTYVAVPPAEVQHLPDTELPAEDEPSAEPISRPDAEDRRPDVRPAGLRKVERMLLIYNDHTFEEYTSRS